MENVLFIQQINNTFSKKAKNSFEPLEEFRIRTFFEKKSKVDARF